VSCAEGGLRNPFGRTNIRAALGERPDRNKSHHVNGTLNVLVAARDAKVKRVVLRVPARCMGNTHSSDS